MGKKRAFFPVLLILIVLLVFLNMERVVLLQKIPDANSFAVQAEDWRWAVSDNHMIVIRGEERNYEIVAASRNDPEKVFVRRLSNEIPWGRRVLLYLKGAYSLRKGENTDMLLVRNNVLQVLTQKTTSQLVKEDAVYHGMLVGSRRQSAACLAVTVSVALDLPLVKTAEAVELLFEHSVTEDFELPERMVLYLFSVQTEQGRIAVAASPQAAATGYEITERIVYISERDDWVGKLHE